MAVGGRVGAADAISSQDLLLHTCCTELLLASVKPSGLENRPFHVNSSLLTIQNSWTGISRLQAYLRSCDHLAFKNVWSLRCSDGIHTTDTDSCVSP